MSEVDSYINEWLDSWVIITKAIRFILFLSGGIVQGYPELGNQSNCVKSTIHLPNFNYTQKHWQFLHFYE